MTLKGVEFLSCSAPPKDQGDTVPSEEGQNGWTAVRALTSLYPVTRQSIDIRDTVLFTSRLTCRMWKIIQEY